MSTPLIEVRIRHNDESSTEARHLCTWPADRLDELVTTVGPWGIHSDYGDYGTSDLSGQIVIEGAAAFFELIVNIDDDDA